MAAAAMMTTTTVTTAMTEPAGPVHGAAARRSWRSLGRRATSIRARFVVGYALLFAVAIGVTVVVTRQVQVARLNREITRDLVQEVEEFRAVAGSINPDTGQPYGTNAVDLFNGFLAQNVAGDHEAFYTLPIPIGPGAGMRHSFDAPFVPDPESELVAAWVAITQPLTATHSTDFGEVRSLAVPVLDASDNVTGVFVVAHFPDEQQADLSRLVRLLALAGIGMLAVTTALAWTIAGRVVAPVRALTRTARGITDSDLSGRIPVAGNDELAELGTTFNEMVDRLERGFEAQRRFLDDIAHDLRTPLTIARGHLEILASLPDGGDAADRAETISIVTDELDRMGRLVSDLLVLAKAEQPDFLRLEPVDYGDLAVDLLSRAEALGDRRWVVDEAPRPGLLAGEADDDRLVQAVLNLAANAVQHTADGDEIGIGVAAVGRPWTEMPPGAAAPPLSVRIWVRDTGAGVPADEVADLFRRHGRGAASRSRRDGRMQEGMGLGLSIVDAIARAHGGTVVYAPASDGGAIFTMTLPLNPEPERPE